MINRKRLQLGIATLILLLSSNVKSEETCQLQCRTPYGNQNLNYQQGATYVYDFISDLDISLSTAKNQKSKTQVKATVFLTPQDGCSYVLQLKNFGIVASNSQTYSIEGIEKPVTFQYNGGLINSSICAEADDLPYSLNVKRSVISLFNLDLNRHQTDVFGVCPTSSESEKLYNGDTFIRRIRNLNHCSKRENLEQSFISEALKDARILESVPILGSRFSTSQVVRNGLVHQASVSENYTYLASGYSREDGAKTSIKSVLKYIESVREMITDSKSMVTKSIIFDNVSPVLHKHSVNTIINLLQKIMLDKLVLSQNSSRDFINLIKIMRESSKDDLVNVFEYLNHDKVRKYDSITRLFVEALIRCGTSAAMTAGLEFAYNGKLTYGEENSLYSSISEIRDPTSHVLQIATDIFSTNRIPQKGYLGIGKLIRRYCEQNDCSDGVVTELLNIFVKKLQGRQPTEVIYVLKALMNVGRLPNEVTDKVLAIVVNPVEATHVRSTAIDVLSSSPCMDAVHNSLLPLIQNVEEDSELRIKAYLVLAQCPNSYLAEAIESMINMEPSQQVGGFISSHLKTTSNILSTVNVRKTFPQDPLKFSFTFETPYTVAGIRGQTKGNVIYSQKSHLPRSVKVNVTGNVLGSNVNLLEIEMRQQNIDRLIENKFGPIGPKAESDCNGLTRTLQAQLDLDVKLFGSDLASFTLDDDYDKILDMFFSSLVDDTFKRTRLTYNEPNHVIFMDSQLSFPTSMGFPLRLGVEGIITMQLHVVVDRIFELFPSANVEVSTSFGLDAHVVENGVKVISKLHVATGVRLEQGGPGPDFKVNVFLPLEQQQASISHDVFFNVRDLGGLEILEPLRFGHIESHTECLKAFSAYTGLDLCLKLDVPPPSNNVYLTGNYKAALLINNTDFSHVSLNTLYTTNDVKMMSFSLGVIGRKQNVKTGLSLEANLKDGFMGKIDVVLPNHNASLEGRYTNRIDEKSVFVQASLDHQKIFGKVGIGILRSGHKTVYSPLVYFAIPGKHKPVYPLNTKGSVIFHDKRNTLSMSLNDLQVILQNGADVKTFGVNGRLEFDVHKHSIDLTFSDGRNVIQLTEKMRFYKTKTKFSSHITNTIRPEFNLHVNYELVYKSMHYGSLLEIVHGNDPYSKINSIIINNTLMQLGNEVKLINRVKYRAVGLDFTFDYANNIFSTAYDVKFQLGKFVCGAKLDAKYGQRHPYDYEVKLVTYDAQHRVGVTGFHSFKDTTHVLNHTLFVNKDVYELSGNIIVPEPKKNPTSSMALVFKSPGTLPIYIKGHFNREQSANCSFLINDQNVKYVNLELVATPSISNFSFQLNAGKVLTVDSQFRNGRGEGNGSLLFFYYDYGFKTNLTYVLGPLYIYKVTIYPDLKPHTSHPPFFVTLSSNTRLGMDFVDSRNSIEVEGKPFYNLDFKYFNRNKAKTLEVDFVMKDLLIDYYNKIYLNGSFISEIPARFDFVVDVNTKSFGPIKLKSFTSVDLPAANSQYAINSNTNLVLNETDTKTLYVDLYGNSRDGYVLVSLSYNRSPPVQFSFDYGLENLKYHLTTIFNVNIRQADFTFFYTHIKCYVENDYLKIVLDYNLHCPALAIKNFKMHIDKDVAYLAGGGYNPIHTVTYNVSRREKNLIFGKSNFSMTFERNFQSYNLTSVVRVLEDTPKEYNAAFQTETDVYRIFGKADVHSLQAALVNRKNEKEVTMKYCDQTNPCIKVEFFHANRSTSEKIQLNERLLLDLRFFGNHIIDIEEIFVETPYAFNITTNMIFNEKTRYNSTFGIKNYNEIVYLIQTPERLILLDGYFKRVSNERHLYELNFYPDKLRQSKQKTSVSYVAEQKRDWDTGRLRSQYEIIFSDPNLERNLNVTFMIDYSLYDYRQEQVLVFDIFQKESDQIIFKSILSIGPSSTMSVREVRSEGLDFKISYFQSQWYQKYPQLKFDYVYSLTTQVGKEEYNSRLVLKASDTTSLCRVNLYDKTVFEVSSEHSHSPDKIKLESGVYIIGLAPLKAQVEIKNFNSLNVTIAPADKPLDAFRFTAKVLGSDLVRVEAMKNKDVLSSTSLTLVKGMRLHFDHSYDEQGIIRHLLVPINGAKLDTIFKLEEHITGVREQLHNSTLDLQTRIHYGVPDFEPLLHSIRMKLYTINAELRKDPVFYDLAPIITDASSDLVNLIKMIKLDEISNAYVTQLLTQQQNIVEGNVILTKYAVYGIVDTLVYLNSAMGRHERDIREFGQAMVNALENTIAIANSIKISLLEVYKKLKQTIIFNNLLNKVDKDTPVSENMINYFKKIINELKTNTESTEVLKLLELVENYTVKKLRKENINDEVALMEISDAFDNVISYISKADNGLKSWRAFNILLKLGELEVYMVSGFLKHIRLRMVDLENIVAVEIAKLNFPLDFVGVVAQNHLFTFDGKHVTINSDCNLLLVKDAVDENFIISASYNGFLKSLTFRQKYYTVTLTNVGGSYLSYEMFENGTCFRSSFSVYRTRDQVIIESPYGVTVNCDNNMEACSIKVSGYYHGRLTGLLGNANNEYYDDFSLPNGKFTYDSQKFVTSHAIGDCRRLQVPTSVTKQPKCYDLFSADNFRYCFQYVDPKEYEQACDEGKHLRIPNTERVASKAYVAKCFQHGVLMKVY